MEPCPFCQSSSMTTIVRSGEWKARVACSCGAEGPVASDETVLAMSIGEPAIREWNIYARARRALGGSNAE